jgi:hypothetical protein
MRIECYRCQLKSQCTVGVDSSRLKGQQHMKTQSAQGKASELRGRPWVRCTTIMCMCHLLSYPSNKQALMGVKSSGHRPGAVSLNASISSRNGGVEDQGPCRCNLPHMSKHTYATAMVSDPSLVHKVGAGLFVLRWLDVPGP